MSEVNNWDVAAANNNDAPPDGWPENTMLYSEVNNSARENMASIRRMWGDFNGSLAAGGVADAYTLTLNAPYAAYFNGMYFACLISATNTGVSTIDVNGLGVQRIIDRAGAELSGGAIQSGGVYEMRYDGTDFQLMGTLTGVATVSKGIFTNSNDPDLVDTNVAIVTGSADPDNNQHLEMGASVIASKSDATTLAVLGLNDLDSAIVQASRLNIAGTVVASSPPVETDNLDTLLELYDGDNTEVLADIGFSGDEVLTITGRVHGAVINLAGERSTGVVATILSADPDGATQLFHQGVLTFQTRNDLTGGEIRNFGGGNVVNLWFLTNAGATRGFVGSTNTDLRIESQVHGLPVGLFGEDAGGTLRTIFQGDPDGAAGLYQAGTETARTLAAASGGLEANNTSTGAGFERVLTTSDIASGFPAAVANFNGPSAMYSFDGATQKTEFDIDANWADGAWESVGPTGSGAQNIYSGMDDIPSDADLLVFRVTRWDIQDDAGSDIQSQLWWRPEASSWSNSNGNRLVQLQTNNLDNNSDFRLASMEFTVPCDSSQRIDLQYTVAFGTNDALALTITGFGRS